MNDILSEPIQEAVSDEELSLSDDNGTNIDGIHIPSPQKPKVSFDPSGPRLIITKIDNNFFKSYAEDQVVGPFHKCFNAIVGPNGSGKSNIIDSLLFVLGHKASKIRCKKVSVLVHNSDKYRHVHTCRVAVHFALIVEKEGDEYDVVPGSKFVVDRIADKNNSSYYELNGKRTQFKDIAVVLKEHGIDLDHNRFLILQGEVEQIAMMKCKGDKDGETGMVEYLEDIIGTSRYKKPLEQVHERVEFLSERRSHKLNRVKLAENEMEELRGPMEESVGFLKTENTVVTNKNFLYQKSMKDIKCDLEVENRSCAEILELQKTLVDKLKAVENQKKELNKTVDKETQVNDNLKRKKESIKESFDRANKKYTGLQADMTIKNNSRKKTKGQIAEEKKKLLKLETVPEECEKNIKEYEAKRVTTIAKKETYDAEKQVLLKTIQKETGSLQAEKEVILKQMIVLKDAVDNTRSAYNLAETELNICISNEESEKNKLEKLKELGRTFQATLEERSRQIADLRKTIPAAEKALGEASAELLQVQQEEPKITNKIRLKRAALDEGKSSLQAFKTSSKVLSSLMQAKREGKCPGLIGRLGDLGSIDSKYDVAVSTACGPLDNILVDTVDCAEWCIGFLKANDIGRSDFIALDKQEHLRKQAFSTIRTPENVPRLYDLIKVNDERVKTAFYFALRDTLVADDLDQARRIAYGATRYRVVTLKGEVIETSGTMTGGGKPIKGRMGRSVASSSFDPKELQQWEGELQAMESRVRELRQKQFDKEAQVNELQPKLRQMRLDLEKYDRESQSVKEQQPNLAKQIKEQEARSKATKADEDQVRKLTAKVEKAKKAYEAAEEKAGVLQVEVDRVNKEIADKSTAKIRTVDKQIQDCQKIIDKCKTEIVKMKVAIKTAERNYNTTKENITRMEQDVEDMENSLRAMKQEMDETEDDAKKLLTCVEKIAEQLEEGNKVFSEVEKELKNLTQQEHQLKSDKIDVDAKVDGHKKKLKEYNGAIQALKAKLAHLKLQEIPDETMEELRVFTEDELDERTADSAEKALRAAEKLLKAAKPNLSAIQEYGKKRALFLKRKKDLEEITIKRSEMRQIYDDLRTRRKEEFLAGYNIIKLKLKEMYQMITLGGDAELEMVDSYDPFTEGIQFNVRPPKKTWKKISNLSGGEKTLSSLALVFALHYYKPSPFYVMDEIDAALDFKNVSIIGNYIKERTKNAQFLIVSLRSNMFELCDHLVGIYKTFDSTKSITINPKRYGKNPAQPAPQTLQNKNPELPQDSIPKNSTGVECSRQIAAPDQTNKDTESASRTDGVTDSADRESTQAEASTNAHNVDNNQENVVTVSRGESANSSQRLLDDSEDRDDTVNADGISKEKQGSTSNNQSLDDSAESGMATTDSHLDDESIPATPSQSGSED